MKFSLFMCDGLRLQSSTFPRRRSIVTMVAGQYCRPLCHPCTPVSHKRRGHSDHIDTLYRGERESMNVLRAEGVHACILSESSLHACVSGCVYLCVHTCLCVSSLSQPAESAVSLRLTAGQKLEQEMNSDFPSASNKFLFSYSDTKDNISALH